MSTIVHHQPVNATLSWNLHAWESAWDGTSAWDVDGTANATTFDFQLPNVPDLRLYQFKYNSVSPTTNSTVWEPDSFVRQSFLPAPAEIWTFEFSPRILYKNPFPAGVVFNAGDVLTVNVITQQQFAGGQIYVWDGYNPSNTPICFPQVARDEVNFISTFNVTLAPWMTRGFHLKLKSPGTGPNGSDVWEPDVSNRVWRTCDGNALWLKSGQYDVRSAPLLLTSFPVEALFPALLANAPALVLTDVAEQLNIPIAASSVTAYAGDPLFKVATYGANIYPGANYTLSSQNNVENPPLVRPFPADPTVVGDVSRCALGASAWLAAFPTTGPVTLSIQPQPVSSFGSGVSVQVSIGNAVAYQSVPAVQQPAGTWLANLTAALDTQMSVRLAPVAGPEPVPYAGIDIGRYSTPSAQTPAWFTAEGVYGICSSGPTIFAEPPSRMALMQAMFGNAVAGSGTFAAREMPHGATLLNDQVYFVVHAPHAVQSTLILVNENGPAGVPVRVGFPMTLTNDTFYWWCQVPAAQAPPGARYHFLLNDSLEVMDPAARAVQDAGSLSTNVGDSPADKTTSWSMVVDVAGAYATAHQSPWQTMGWEKLLIYEIHANRFTNLNPGGLMPLDLLADELSANCRRGGPGYLLQLPVMTFELMPVSEFSSTLSWGYDPSYYFAIDGFYGGAGSLANFVNTAHANGRSVILDLVYNHSLGSSLMQIAPEVYGSGPDPYGDGMNCGHPMTTEFLRQATIYLWRTFGLDGFRFDDTALVITSSTYGWQFLGNLRQALRTAATAEGRAWPYCVAENSNNPWAVSNPQSGVLDGQWEIDESYRILDASYDSGTPGSDHSGPLANEMNQPSYSERPFFQATRFGESHDMVSAQDSQQLDQRIAARPPFGQGYQLAKAMGTLTLLSNGVPMLFMGQEVGETLCFSFDNAAQPVNPQQLPAATAIDQTRILAWFVSLMGLRNDPSKGLQGESNYQVVGTGNRTAAYTCGAQQGLFVVVTFGTPNQQQNSGWLGLPAGTAFKEIFNSSWPVFQVEFEPENANGGYTAQIYSGQILNLPAMGAVVLERV
jgi:1,4-alpha-glucan branching enzyme